MHPCDIIMDQVNTWVKEKYPKRTISRVDMQETTIEVQLDDGHMVVFLWPDGEVVTESS